MKISTKGRYGLRAILDLAIHSKDEYISLKNIADRLDLSMGYLEQVFSVLRKSGFIKSVKGPQGGYTLEQRPSRISVGEILISLEGSLSVSDYADGGSDIEKVIKTKVWKEIDDRVYEFINGLTLQDLIDEYEKTQNSKTFMYHI